MVGGEGDPHEPIDTQRARGARAQAASEVAVCENMNHIVLQCTFLPRRAFSSRE
jgi:hypothetical protein